MAPPWPCGSRRFRAAGNRDDSRGDRGRRALSDRSPARLPRRRRDAFDHVKPHGALMGMAQRQEEVAEGIADAMEVLRVPIIVVGNCVLAEVLAERGVPFVREFYADLDYDDHGIQVITRHHEAIAPACAKAQGRARDSRGQDLSTSTSSRNRFVSTVIRPARSMSPGQSSKRRVLICRKTWCRLQLDTPKNLQPTSANRRATRRHRVLPARFRCA